MQKRFYRTIAGMIAAAMLLGLACLLAGCNKQPTDSDMENNTSAAYAFTYLDYISWSSEEKQAYMDKFSTVEEKLAFIQWINNEEEKYKATMP